MKRNINAGMWGMALSLLASTAATADSVPRSGTAPWPTGVVLHRDSDGLVISVIDYTTTGGGDFGEIYYTFDGGVIGLPVQMAGATGQVTAVSEAGGNPALNATADVVRSVTFSDAGAMTSVSVGGVVYRVETAGQNIWFVNQKTGERFQANRRVGAAAPDAEGRSVNPLSFAIN